MVASGGLGLVFPAVFMSYEGDLHAFSFDLQVLHHFYVLDLYESLPLCLVDFQTCC